MCTQSSRLQSVVLASEHLSSTRRVTDSLLGSRSRARRGVERLGGTGTSKRKELLEIL